MYDSAVSLPMKFKDSQVMVIVTGKRGKVKEMGVMFCPGGKARAEQAREEEVIGKCVA